MKTETITMINNSGREVRVAARRKKHLLRKGFELVEEGDQDLSELSRSELYDMAKEANAELADWSMNKEALIDIIEEDEE